MNNIPTSQISQDIVVDNSFLYEDIFSSNISIDAFFIPSLGNRKNILKLIDVINEYRSTNIFILSSGSTKILSEVPSNVSIIDFKKEQHHRSIRAYNSSINPTYYINSEYDLPTKRNFALNLSKQKGFKYIGLIDDDIMLSKQQLQKVSHLLEQGAKLAGFYSMDFPDKSTIDLIECKLLQIPPSIFLSGNCLFINVQSCKGFFPYVYNEDWMFIITNMKSLMMGAGFVNQCHHEPWDDFQRIKFEQFGDIIALGIKKSQIHLSKQLIVDIEFWESIYASYLNRLNKLHKISKEKNKYQKQIELALDTVKSFSANDIVKFVNNYINEVNKFEYEKVYY